MYLLALECCLLRSESLLSLILMPCPSTWKKIVFVQDKMIIVLDKIIFVQDKKFCLKLKSHFSYNSSLMMNFLSMYKIFCSGQKIFCLRQFWFCPGQKSFCLDRWIGHKAKSECFWQNRSHLTLWPFLQINPEKMTSLQMCRIKKITPCSLQIFWDRQLCFYVKKIFVSEKTQKSELCHFS